MNVNISKRLGLLLVALLAVSTVGVGLGGTAAAQTGETTTTADDGLADDRLLNSTVALNNDTTDVWVEVENASENVTASVYGVYANGSETDSPVGTVSFDAGTDTVEEVAVDPLEYEDARVVVEASTDGTAVEADTVDAGIVTRVAGGGGGGASSVSTNVLLGGAVALIVLLGLGAAVLEEGR